MLRNTVDFRVSRHLIKTVADTELVDLEFEVSVNGTLQTVVHNEDRSKLTCCWSKLFKHLIRDK